jgi:hypothetical protein
MQYHEVRIVAEPRKQGEHERAEEFRLKAMPGTRRRTPDHLVSSAGTPSDSPPLQIAARYAAGKASTVNPTSSWTADWPRTHPHHIRTTKEVRSDDTHAGGGIRPPRRGARSG